MLTDPATLIADAYADVLTRIGTPRHVCEIAAGSASKCFAAAFIGEAERITLVEPQPALFSTLVINYRLSPGVELHNVAVMDAPGTVEVCCHPAGSTDGYVYGEDAPCHSRNVKYTDRVQVESVRMTAIDPGTIDLLWLDSEGCEWYALRHMVSRPRMIRVEMEDTDHGYRNRFLLEIEDWLADEGYEKVGIQDADWVYVR